MQGNLRDNIISAAAADKLLAAHDGDLALLYIFMQRSGRRDLEAAAAALCRTMREIEAAWEKLQRMGLVDEGPACEVPRTREVLLPPADELPEYLGVDILQRCQEDSTFSDLLKEAERVMGKKLSSPDLRKLFGFYDHLALPAEVIMLLLNYCVDASMGPSGTGRAPSMRYIEKEAYNWVNREIYTLEQAEEYIERTKRRREDSGSLAEALGIKGRKLVPTEEKYINAWLDMGFDREVLMLAYDRTMTNTHELKWSYMNKILLNWQEKGYRSVSEINEKDGQRAAAGAGRGPATRPIDIKKLEDELGKI